MVATALDHTPTVAPTFVNFWSMVRKKRKIPSSEHTDDILSVKRKRELSSRLLSPAFPMESVKGWETVSGWNLLPPSCDTVHHQLQALQAYRRKMTVALEKIRSNGRNEVTRGDSTKVLDFFASRCYGLSIYLVNLISMPESGKFHKICSLMLDDAFKLRPTETVQATANALNDVRQKWSMNNASSSDGNVNVATLSDGLSSLLSTSLVSTHILREISPKDNREVAESLKTHRGLLVVEVFYTLLQRMNYELVKSGCSIRGKGRNAPMLEQTFAHGEADVRKLLCVLLKFLQTSSIDVVLETLGRELHEDTNAATTKEESSGRKAWLIQIKDSVSILIRHLHQILRCSACAKDTLTMASMCIVILARNFYIHGSMIGNEIGKTSRLTDLQSLAKDLLSGSCRWLDDDVFVSDCGQRAYVAPVPYSDLTTLAVCRGILKGLPTTALTHATLEVLINEKKESTTPSSLLYPNIFGHIHHCCMSSTTDATRTYAFQSLQQWMSIAAKVKWKLQDSTFPTNVYNTEDARKDQAKLVESVLDRIQDVVLANWDHKSRTVSHMMPVIFKSLLAAQDQIKEDKTDLLQSRMVLLELFLSQPPGCRGTYPAIEMLLPKIGARKLLFKVPMFFTRMLRALMDPTNVSSLVAHLIVTVIQRLRQEQLNPNDECTGLEYNTHAEDWISHIADALTSNDAALGKQTATYVLPPLIRQGGIENIERAQQYCKDNLSSLTDGQSGKKRRRRRRNQPDIAVGNKLRDNEVAEIEFRRKHDVDFAAKLLRKIRIKDEKHRTLNKNIEDGCLRACLHVVAAARDTVAPVVTKSSTGGNFPYLDLFAYMTHDEVERALLHSDPSVRFRALRLICVSRRTSRFPSTIEFELVRKHLPLFMKRYCFYEDSICDTTSDECIKTSQNSIASRKNRITSPSAIDGGVGLGRSQTTALLKHFLTRIHDGVQHHRRSHVRVLQTKQSFERKHKHISKTMTEQSFNELAKEKETVLTKSRSDLKIIVDRANEFLSWIETFLLGSVHPGASFERSSTSLELLLLISRIWGKKKKTQKVRTDFHVSDPTDNSLLHDVLGESVMAGVCHNETHIGVLLNATVVTWDRVRELSCRILSDIQGGWPGFHSSYSLKPVLDRALALAGSPRRREYEAGAQVLALLFSKFVLKLGWNMPFQKDTHSGGDFSPTVGASMHESSSAVFQFCQYMCEILSLRLRDQQTRMDRMVNAAISGAANVHYMDMGGIEQNDENIHAHGIILMFRQILPYIAKVHSSGNDSELGLRRVFSKLLQSVLQALQSALTVVADDNNTQTEDINSQQHSDDTKTVEKEGSDQFSVGKQEYLARGVVSTVGIGSRPPLTVDCRGHLLLPRKSDKSVNESSDEEDALSKQHQAVVVTSWLLVKEGSVLLADMVSCLPLEGDLTQQGAKDSSVNQNWLISSNDVHLIGQRMVKSLLGLKHMGAISSAGQAFSIICRRLMQMYPAAVRSDDHNRSERPNLQDLPRVWLRQLLELVCPQKVLRSLPEEYNQHRLLVPHSCEPSSLSDHSTVLFFLRRSTGLATAFVSILRAEPFRGSKATLLQACVAGLVGSLSQGLALNTEPSLNKSSEASSSSNVACLPWQSRVHALNILKLIFEDSVLAPDLHSWSSSTLRISMLGFRSSNWAVRNSSMMLFAILLRHTVGGKVVHSDGSSHNRVTASQFFTRLPLLRDFVKREMANVVDFKSTKKKVSTERSLLYPLLMLLSRLRPSLFEEDVQSNALFVENKLALGTTATSSLIPMLQKCAFTDRHFSARVMAARAVSNLTPSGECFLEMIKKICGDIKELAAQSKLFVPDDHNASHGILVLAKSLVSSLYDRTCISKVFNNRSLARVEDLTTNYFSDIQKDLISLSRSASNFGMNLCSLGIETGSADYRVISVCGHLIDATLQLVAACMDFVEEEYCIDVCLDASMLACLALSLPRQEIHVLRPKTNISAESYAASGGKIPLLMTGGSEMRNNACYLLGKVATGKSNAKSADHALQCLVQCVDTHWCPDVRQSCIGEICKFYSMSEVQHLYEICHKEQLQERLLKLMERETHAPSYCIQLGLQRKILCHLSSQNLLKSNESAPLKSSYTLDALSVLLWKIMKAQGIVQMNKLCSAPAVVAASIKLAGEIISSFKEHKNSLKDSEMYKWFTEVAVVNVKQEEQLSDQQKRQRLASCGTLRMIPSAEIRLAVAEAIRRSYILVHRTNVCTKTQIQAWDTILGMMQDDSSSVRTEARHAVCMAIPQFKGRKIIASKCIRDAYSHLVSKYSSAPESSSILFKYLFSRLEFHSSRIEQLDLEAKSKACNASSRNTKFSGQKKYESLRVFDEVRENFFVEHVLEVEQAHKAIMRMIQCKYAWKALFADGEDLLTNLRKKLSQRLEKTLLAMFCSENHDKNSAQAPPEKIHVDEAFFRGAYATILACHFLVVFDCMHTCGKWWLQSFRSVVADCRGLSINTFEFDSGERLTERFVINASSNNTHPALTKAFIFFCRSLSKENFEVEAKTCLIFAH